MFTSPGSRGGRHREPSRFTLVSLTIGNGSTLIATGPKGFRTAPVGRWIIRSWFLQSTDPSALSGSIQVDIWKRALSASYPPSVADSITNGHSPAIVGATYAQGTDLSNWLTPGLIVEVGDSFGWNVDSVTTFTLATLDLVLEQLR